jgi:GAF domain-containing protein
LDDEREQVVLRASNSEGGRKMLARGHHLKVGQAGIVSHVAASGTPHIALDVELGAAFKDNPDLLETHSELALPLKADDQIIGVLDMQSTEVNTFQSEDTEILYILADQVAIAIQNARSHESTRRLLDEAQKASASYLKETWRLLQSQEKKVGYLVSENTVKPLEKFVSTPQINRAVSQGEVLLEDGNTATLALPIRLRDEIVGVMDIHVPAGHDWDPDEVDIAKAVADRLSLALETATLLESTQRRAEIERLTADISAKVSASINLRNVLQTAVEELGSVLPGSDIVIQFSSDSESVANTERK